MNFRIAAFCGALVLALSACPPTTDNSDGGTDAGGIVPPSTAGCTAECGPNEVCNTQTHLCEPGCNPACEVGQICVKNGDTLSCETPATTCNGEVCEPGQSACINGHCSCLDLNHAARDTCSDVGKVCHQLYDSVGMSGGQCEDAKQYEFCGTDCDPDTESCGPGSCPEGDQCKVGFFAGIGTCHRSCKETVTPTGQVQIIKACGADERCSTPQGAALGTCFPRAVFGSTETYDGGAEVPNPWGCKVGDPNDWTKQSGTHPSSACLAIVGEVQTNTEFRPMFEQNGVTGTCTYLFVKTDTTTAPIAYCRSPGKVAENGACNTDPMPLTTDLTCQSGLECVPKGPTGNAGICMRICNAHEKNGVPGFPGCNAGESCVNIYRTDENNGNVGACMKSCNVFSDTAPTFGCAPMGSVQTACVPTSAQGAEHVSLNGDGFCAPVLGTAKTEGQACSQTDAMTGTDCASGLICTQLPGASQSTCVKPCDVECKDTAGGTTPSRCHTEANATCSGGKTCAAVNSASGSTMGLCQ